MPLHFFQMEVLFVETIVERAASLHFGWWTIFLCSFSFLFLFYFHRYPFYSSYYSYLKLLVYTLVGELFFYRKGHSISETGTFFYECVHFRYQKRWVTSAFSSPTLDVLIV